MILFLIDTLREETISQHKLTGQALIKELLNFVENEFDASRTVLDLSGTVDLDESEETTEKKIAKEGLMQRIKLCCQSKELKAESIEFVE